MKITRVLMNAILAVAIAAALLFTPSAANARVFVSVGFAPPLIPVYAQPIAPGYGYIWTPGYWAYGDDGYYWVDGAWVYPPYVGALWTPGYWGGAAESTSGTPATGAAGWATTAASTMALATSATGFWGGYWHGGRFFYNGAYTTSGFHDGTSITTAVSGFDGRPGGAAFARSNVAGLNRGAIAENRGEALTARASSTAVPRLNLAQPITAARAATPAHQPLAATPAHQPHAVSPAAVAHAASPAAVEHAPVAVADTVADAAKQQNRSI